MIKFRGATSIIINLIQLYLTHIVSFKMKRDERKKNIKTNIHLFYFFFLSINAILHSLHTNEFQIINLNFNEKFIRTTV